MEPPAMSLHNNPSDARAYTRRDFLNSSLILASAAFTVPSFIQRSAYALPQPGAGLASIPGVPEDRVLVVVQLSGGNDGLNTVIPYLDDTYYRVRPSLGLARDQVLSLAGANGADVGLHRALEQIKSLYDNGQCAVVQGVGYPNPNRSHFKSMDIWHTAETSGTGDGWLGRYVDAECCGYGKGESGTPDGSAPVQIKAVEPPVSIGRTAPLALMGRTTKPVSFETADLFRWTGQDVHKDLLDPYRTISERPVPAEVDEHSTAAFLMRTSMDAQIASDSIRRAVSASPLVQYPNSDLARQLEMVSKMIRAGMKTRVYYVNHGGFDTHSGQGGPFGRHANLLQQFAEAIGAFYRDLERQGNAARVLTMSFSEFGRRVAQNASQGTDHGTAAPMFLFGPMVAAGVIGSHPSLTDLDQGDLKYGLDFRSVYAGILEDWLVADSTIVLEDTFRPAKVIRSV
ncbi:MAG: DUF1501 domain-containing protein [Leptolyngbya sp. PLA3]|nr:MAG: DUF1501 domain-containing protein [Cyanobacteria bacterium CYA]MCE7967756.1 DUF1501 domain-containing protein [Leptolyngbya sp. PL-A3]